MTGLKGAAAALACSVALVAAARGAPTDNSGVPRGGKVVARIAIPQGSGGPRGRRGRAVWTMSDAVSTLLRIDPERNAVIARIKVKPRTPCPPFRKLAARPQRATAPYGFPTRLTTRSRASIRKRTASSR
jgi:hypothetical protein